MGFKLDQVVPWGRSHFEYVRMFNLTPVEGHLKILDCAGGPASFNAQMTAQGYPVISCDPIYQFTASEIQRRIQATYPQILAGVKEHSSNYCWQGEITSPDALGQVRMTAMNQFIQDFPIGLEQQRYLAAELPDLPFADHQFDLALCSHLLFTYSDHLSLDFHRKSLIELCRVASEVRIFPLVNLSGEPSPHLPSLLADFQVKSYQVEIVAVNYEFQKGGNQMLKISCL